MNLSAISLCRLAVARSVEVNACYPGEVMPFTVDDLGRHHYLFTEDGSLLKFPTVQEAFSWLERSGLPIPDGIWVRLRPEGASGGCPCPVTRALSPMGGTLGAETA